MSIVFVQNVALVISAVALYNLIIRHYDERKAFYHLLSGILFGLVAIFGMMMPFTVEPGIIFDGRSIILLVAGLFGGPVVAGIAVAFAATYRLMLGGAGLWVGLFI